jgi:hypothetical protein
VAAAIWRRIVSSKARLNSSVSTMPGARVDADRGRELGGQQARHVRERRLHRSVDQEPARREPVHHRADVVDDRSFPL